MPDMDIATLKNEFTRQYGINGDIAVYFGPGRVNLIGEHTDYNGGYVFPCALDFGTYLLARKSKDQVIRFTTTNFPTRAEVAFRNIHTKLGKAWINYPLGVINQFVEKGYKLIGMDLLFSGNVPNGAGLSSSASIEMVTAVTLNDIYHAGFTMTELALLSQRAENVFVGMNCGIMDQFASGMGKKDTAIFLKCDTLEYELVPIVLKEHDLVIVNTNKRRGLTDSKYNERRAECEKALEYLSKIKKIPNLSALTLEGFEAQQHLIPDSVVRKRARHVISENRRVLDAIPALKAGDLHHFGQLMNQSHDSLRDDYEVTGIELDTLVEEARLVPGVIGSRMTGAGFGGCTVSLIEKVHTLEFIENVGRQYEARTRLRPDFYIPKIGDGARRLE
jgi:galactokinase